MLQKVHGNIAQAAVKAVQRAGQPGPQDVRTSTVHPALMATACPQAWFLQTPKIPISLLKGSYHTLTGQIPHSTHMPGKALTGARWHHDSMGSSHAPRLWRQRPA